MMNIVYSSTFVNAALKLIKIKRMLLLLVEVMEELQENVFQEDLILLIGMN